MSASNVERTPSRSFCFWDVEAIVEVGGSCKKAAWFPRGEEKPCPPIWRRATIRSCLTPCKHRRERSSRLGSLFGRDTQPVGYDCRPRGFQPTERLREQGRYNVRSASGVEIPKFSSKHLPTFRNALIDGSSNDSYNDALLKALGEPPTPMKSKKH